MPVIIATVWLTDVTTSSYWCEYVTRQNKVIYLQLSEIYIHFYFKNIALWIVKLLISSEDWCKQKWTVYCYDEVYAWIQELILKCNSYDSRQILSETWWHSRCHCKNACYLSSDIKWYGCIMYREATNRSEPGISFILAGFRWFDRFLKNCELARIWQDDV